MKHLWLSNKSWWEKNLLQVLKNTGIFPFLSIVPWIKIVVKYLVSPLLYTPKGEKFLNYSVTFWGVKCSWIVGVLALCIYGLFILLSWYYKAYSCSLRHSLSNKGDNCANYYCPSTQLMVGKCQPIWCQLNLAILKKIYKIEKSSTYNNENTYLHSLGLPQAFRWYKFLPQASGIASAAPYHWIWNCKR